MATVASKIELFPIGDLIPLPGNARMHPQKQVEGIADSMKRFGFLIPCLIDEDNMILAGHGRVAAAKLLGLTHAPCLRKENLTPRQKRAYALVDNRMSDLSDFDHARLMDEVEALAKHGITPDDLFLGGLVFDAGKPMPWTECECCGAKVDIPW